MAAHERPHFSSRGYSDVQSNVFYETEVKKDSEIQLSDQQAQELLRKAEMHSPAQQRHSAIIGRSYNQSIAVTSSSTDSSLVDSTNRQTIDRLSQDSQPISTISSSAGGESTSLEQINDVLQSQSDDYKRLSQSDRAHMCLVCYKGFRNKPQLTQHELVHNNVRKHVCSYCDKSFKQVCHLNQHKRVHTGERPYKCDVEGCGRSFAQLSNLNHHKKNHEEHVKRDVSRQFRCDVCDRSYATNQSLNTHFQKLHTNLKAAEGSVTSPILSPLPAKRRRKSSQKSDGGSSDIQDSFIMDCDNIDDNGDLDLPTEVKVKSRYMNQPSSRSNLMVKIGTPTGNGDRDKANKGPRTTLPLPLAFTQSSTTDVRGHQGLDSFVSVMSDHSTNPIHHHNIVDTLSQQIYSQSSSVIMSHAQHLSHQSSSIHDQISESQRELMEARMDVGSKKGYLPSKQGQNQSQPHYSSSMHHNLPDIKPLITQTHSPHLTLTDTPSHIAHHFPKLEVSVANQLRSESQNLIFNPAFSSHDSRVPQNNYGSNHY